MSFGLIEIINGANKIDSVSHRGETGSIKKNGGKFLDGIEDASEEKLREDEEGKNLIGCFLIIEITHDKNSESPTKRSNDNGNGEEAKETGEGDGNANDETKKDDTGDLDEGNESFTDNFTHDDGVARNGRNEEFLSEVVLTIFDERDDTSSSGLEKGLA